MLFLLIGTYHTTCTILYGRAHATRLSTDQGQTKRRSMHFPHTTAQRPKLKKPKPVTTRRRRFRRHCPYTKTMRVSTYSLVILAALASSIDAFAPTMKPHASSSLLRAESPAAPSASSNFLTPELAQSCIDVASGTPLYAYSLAALAKSADDCLAFPNAYGLTVRYAMKACPNGSILKYFLSRGICIDASSGFEVRRAMDMGVPAEKISLSSQELPGDFAELVKMGVKVNAW